MVIIFSIIACLFTILISLLMKITYTYINEEYNSVKNECYIYFDEKAPLESDQEIKIINNQKIVILDKNKTIFGRSKNADITIKDKKVSQIHFVIYKNKGQCYIVDRESCNGTFVNNQKIKKQYLVSNDHIVVGETSMRYEKRVRYK